MASWPATLPPIPLPVQYAPRDTRIRTAMAVGPDKVRARTTAETTDIPPVQMLLTKSQTDDLETFFTSTLKGGTDTFTWDDPRTGLSSDRFRFVDRPSYSAVTSDPSASGRLWFAAFSLEIIL